MRNGGLKSFFDSLMSHLDDLDEESVILVTGNCIEVVEGVNVIYRNCREVEKMTELPRNVKIVLSTEHRSHTLGQRLKRLAKDQHRKVPEYILPAGMLKEALGFILKQIRPEEDKAVALPTSSSRAVVRPKSRPVVEQPQTKLVMITFEQACELFEANFTRGAVRRLSDRTLREKFAKILQASGFNLTSGQRTTLEHVYRCKANQPRPPRNQGRRRSRNGNLRRLRKKRW